MNRPDLELEKTLRGVTLVAASAIVWSTGGLIVRLLESADSWTTVFWRSASACLFLLVFLAMRDGRKMFGLFRQMGWPGLGVGFFFASASISFVVALNLTSVAKTLVIMSCTPLLAAIFGRVFLGEPIRPATYVTIAAVMGGIALMVSDSLGSGSALGDFFAFLIPVSFAGVIVITRRYHEIRMTPAACAGAAIAMLASLAFATPFSVTAHDLPLLFLFGAGQLGAGMALFVTGARLIPAAHSALLGMLEPILGPMWVWLALGEKPAEGVLVGGTIVIASVVAKTLLDIRKR
ncbi:MAG: DMT family transporter [Hyphomicrobiales bacterium]|nr:DMT family transporter [Hyphomicrobiales bacterium]